MTFRFFLAFRGFGIGAETGDIVWIAITIAGAGTDIIAISRVHGNKTKTATSGPQNVHGSAGPKVAAFENLTPIAIGLPLIPSKHQLATTGYLSGCRILFHLPQY